MAKLQQVLATVDEVSEWLQVSKQRVYELARNRVIPSVRLGRQVRFDPDEIKEFIRSGGVTH